MATRPSDVRKAKRLVKQTRTVVQQWSSVLAEGFGLRRPTHQMPAPTCDLDAGAWAAASLGACWLGHATALLRVGGATVLTDPHFDDRAGVTIGRRKIGRRRVVAPPLMPENLLPVDVLLLSHAHMDHWDTASLLRLSQTEWAHRTRVLLPRGTRRLLPPGFGEVIELPWDQEARIDKLVVRAIRPRHWGARFLVDRGRGYNAYLLDAPSRRVLFGGDTAMTDAFDPLGADQRLLDLAVMGIGSYEPWHEQHATPEQVAEMARRMNARLLMPIHHATFHDANVPLDEPMRRLVRAWDPARIVCGRVGELWLD